ncbi:MAG: hypothetical protein NT040_05460 [Bacteroidetes bacterium]|nr:hypothetical protein [Bacteroidota bacterium]
MNNLETQLKNLLREFTFSDSQQKDIADKSFFGTLKFQATKFRNPNKALILNSGTRHFYVSSVMYHDNPTMESFRYMIVWTMAKIRPYKCKTFRDYELNKVFISGKTDEILIENLSREIENGKI